MVREPSTTTAPPSWRCWCIVDSVREVFTTSIAQPERAHKVWQTAETRLQPLVRWPGATLPSRDPKGSGAWDGSERSRPESSRMQPPVGRDAGFAGPLLGASANVCRDATGWMAVAADMTAGLRPYELHVGVQQRLTGAGGRPAVEFGLRSAKTDLTPQKRSRQYARERGLNQS